MAEQAGFEPADELPPVDWLAISWFKPLTHCSKDKGQIAEYYLYDNILLSLIYKLPKLTWRWLFFLRREENK